MRNHHTEHRAAAGRKKKIKFRKSGSESVFNPSCESIVSMVVPGRTAREPAHCQHWTVFVFAVAIKNYHNVNFPSWLDCGAGLCGVCAAPRGVISCVVM